MITRDDVAAAQRFAMHANMGRNGHLYQYRFDGIPRLAASKHSSRGRGLPTVITWFVDNIEMPSLAAALEVLNGTRTMEDVMEERRRASIDAQIAEVEYELEQRRKVYANIG